MIDPEILEQIGLSVHEAQLYATLLEIGQGSITALAGSTHLHRPTIYQAIKRLEMLGLVNKSPYGKRLLYTPAHPRRVLEVGKLRYNSIEKSLPKLVAAYERTGQAPQAGITEGMDAVRRIYHEVWDRLKNGEELCIITNIGRVTELFPEIPTELDRIMGSVFNKARVRELVANTAAGAEYAQKYADQAKQTHQVRIAPQQYIFGDNEQFILRDKIIYFSLQKQIFVVTIENADLARTHKSLFDMAWAQASNERYIDGSA